MRFALVWADGRISQRRLFGSASALQSRQCHARDCGFENVMSGSQGIIQPSAFLELGFVQMPLVHERPGRFAALMSQRLDAVCLKSRAADG